MYLLFYVFKPYIGSSCKELSISIITGTWKAQLSPWDYWAFSTKKISVKIQLIRKGIWRWLVHSRQVFASSLTQILVFQPKKRTRMPWRPKPWICPCSTALSHPSLPWWSPNPSSRRSWQTNPPRLVKKQPPKTLSSSWFIVVDSHLGSFGSDIMR